MRKEKKKLLSNSKNDGGKPVSGVKINLKHLREIFLSCTRCLLVKNLKSNSLLTVVDPAKSTRIILRTPTDRRFLDKARVVSYHLTHLQGRKNRLRMGILRNDHVFAREQTTWRKWK